MPFTGKRMTEPPPGLSDTPPPTKRRKGRVLTGRYNTIPPDELASTSAGSTTHPGNTSSSTDSPTLWVWKQHTTSRLAEYRKTEVPIELSQDPGEEDKRPEVPNTTTDNVPLNEGHRDEGTDDNRPPDDTEEPTEPRASWGKVSFHPPQ
jgi:hypothetical protein